MSATPILSERPAKSYWQWQLAFCEEALAAARLAIEGPGDESHLAKLKGQAAALEQHLATARAEGPSQETKKILQFSVQGLWRLVHLANGEKVYKITLPAGASLLQTMQDLANGIIPPGVTVLPQLGGEDE